MSRWVLTGSVIRGEGSVGAGRAAFETILYPAATLTLCLLFTGTLADAETADLQVGGKVPVAAGKAANLEGERPLSHLQNCGGALNYRL
jgi:hypothetical protein